MLLLVKADVREEGKRAGSLRGIVVAVVLVHLGKLVGNCNCAAAGIAVARPTLGDLDVDEPDGVVNLAAVLVTSVPE